ncbi:MAG: squalene/phytoene synthase family protein [Acidobacteria bacterium]|jgi:phytoene synthase|nr:squalene/phytoene synthase family protein [Acidobacteriota bacterium]
MVQPLEHVRQFTRAAKSNFYYAFLTLPPAQRDGIVAVYAFCRAADNAVDDAPDRASAERELSFWREELGRAFEGNATHPVAVRAGEAAREFGLGRGLFDEVLDGVGWDIAPRRFARFEELASYCDLVAGAVGRLTVRILGHREPEADEYARQLGLAMQLTNILRDLGPDAAAGRFYLPQEDLERFRLDEAGVLGGDPRRIELLRFEAGRARACFEAARSYGRRWPRDLCAAEAMAAIYRRLLDRVEGAGFPPGPRRIELPRPLKAWLAARAFLRGRLARA